MFSAVATSSHHSSELARPQVVSGEQLSYTERHFELRSGVVAPVELSYRVFHNHQGDPFEKPVVIVHKALTGTTNAFTDEKKTQGDGWANHLKELKQFDLKKYTVMVVEPLGGNAEGLESGYLSSGRDFFEEDPKIEVSSFDTVNLITKALASHGVDTVENIFCFSMGGIMLPGWIEQDQIKVNVIHNIYSDYTITAKTREYWEIQLALLATDGQIPDFKKIAQDLRGNFDVKEHKLDDSTFTACVHSLAAKVKQLDLQFDPRTLEAYRTEALKVVRGISFLRFQTKENFNNKEVGKCIDFLDAQGECFPDRMDALNYAYLLKLMLDQSFPDPKELVKKKQPNLKITYLMDSADMLFPVNDFFSAGCCLGDKSNTIRTAKGHDGFLGSGFSSAIRRYL